MSEIKAELEIGKSFDEFLRSFILQEKIPKELRQRADYIYIYIRNYIVDRVCFYNKQGKILRRFCKNTQFKEENGRAWINPKSKYTIAIGDNKLQDDKIYFIQCKPDNTARVYQVPEFNKVQFKSPVFRDSI